MITLMGSSPLEFLQRAVVEGASEYFNKETGAWKGEPEKPSMSLEECEERLEGSEGVLKEELLRFLTKML